MFQLIVFIVLTPVFMCGLLLFWLSRQVKTAGLWLMSMSLYCRGDGEMASEIWNEPY